MEGVREPAAVRYVRISWTQARERSLLGIAEGLDPSLKGEGRERELEKQWLAENTTLPSRGSALGRKLGRLKKAMASESNPPEDPVVPGPESAPEAGTGPELDPGNAPPSHVNQVSLT